MTHGYETHPLEVRARAKPARVPFEFRFELAGLPPSANRLVRPARVGKFARLVKTAVASGWLQVARMSFLAAWRRDHGGKAPIAGLPLTLHLHFTVSRINADVSNRVKALEDALTGIAWVDDCQVVELHAMKSVGVERTRGVVRIAAHVDEETQRRIKAARKAGA